MTLALLPLGPFFCGMALYVHVKPADVQFLQGRVPPPSPMHLTFLRWQASQALLAVDGVDADDESGIVLDLGNPRGGTGTSTGPLIVEISMRSKT